VTRVRRAIWSRGGGARRAVTCRGRWPISLRRLRLGASRPAIEISHPRTGCTYFAGRGPRARRLEAIREAKCFIPAPSPPRLASGTGMDRSSPRRRPAPRRGRCRSACVRPMPFAHYCSDEGFGTSRCLRPQLARWQPRRHRTAVCCRLRATSWNRCQRAVDGHGRGARRGPTSDPHLRWKAISSGEYGSLRFLRNIDRNPFLAISQGHTLARLRGAGCRNSWRKAALHKPPGKPPHSKSSNPATATGRERLGETVGVAF
jgi:hypothetical protein